MSTKANNKKSEQLGVNYGTAYHKLRKKILFALVQELKKDNCFQCRKQIENEKDFSIEHKEPWLDNSPELFWSLNNIAFSHLSCNIRASRIPHKIIAPNGMNWCWDCKQFKVESSFPAYATKIRKQCTFCYSQYRQEYRKRTGKR